MQSVNYISYITPPLCLKAGISAMCAAYIKYYYYFYFRFCFTGLFFSGNYSRLSLVLQRFPEKILWWLLLRDILQAWCPSCYANNSVAVAVHVCPLCTYDSFDLRLPNLARWPNMRKRKLGFYGIDHSSREGGGAAGGHGPNVATIRQYQLSRYVLCGGYNYDSTAIRRPFNCLSKIIKFTVTSDVTPSRCHADLFISAAVQQPLSREVVT